MRAAILCVGTELSRGETRDANGAWIARALAELGVEVAEISIVPDDPAAISAALERLSAVHELLLCTGGLGPTTDDITASVAARVLGVRLVRDAGTLERIRSRLATLGRPLTESNAKQADIPADATLLPNDAGTAPGFAVRLGQAKAWFMPGVPHEMQAMFSGSIAPSLMGLPPVPTSTIVLRTFGVGESVVNDRLAGIEAEYEIVLGYQVRFPEVLVKVQARAGSPGEATERARRAAAAVLRRLGPDVYGEGDRALPAVLSEKLAMLGLSLAVAESCTGGMVGALMTELPGASRVLEGGAIVYSNAAKQTLLGVPGAMLATYGAVSGEVALAMAEGALRACRADVALAITGIAGPGGGTSAKPVGLVELAVVGGGKSRQERAIFPGSRTRVRTLAAWNGMRLVLDHLRGWGGP
ncbi:MAG: CinA family nicotinamide mononucleotide deamidase-related protein [Polyangiaceae bacterium]|nr:CinA family nicotinamide mononucleotide deamidase-related protein [Polyangiaceae bacterium]